ncbi:unnamed protein product [Acidithrix sp. C25]|nr:unnamed protein product [Acidithrix sp. C25]
MTARPDLLDKSFAELSELLNLHSVDATTLFRIPESTRLNAKFKSSALEASSQISAHKA